MENNSKSILITIIITALIVGGGVYFWQNQNSEMPTTEIENTQTDELNTTEPETKDELENNQTETLSLNQEGGFSFEYPADWNAEKVSSPEIRSEKVSVTSPDWNSLEQGAEFLVLVNPAGSAYEYLVNDLDTTEINLDGMNVTQSLLSDESGNVNAAIIQLNKDDNFYFIKFEFVASNDTENEQYLTILDNILASFSWAE